MSKRSATLFAALLGATALAHGAWAQQGEAAPAPTDGPGAPIAYLAGPVRGHQC